MATTKNTLIIMFILSTFAVAPFAGGVAYAKAYKTGERRSGQNKICYYRDWRGTKAITIKSYQLCPLSID